MSSSLHIDNIELTREVYASEFIILKRTASTDSLSLLARQIYKNNYDFIDEVIGTETEICLKINEHYKPGALTKLESIRLSDTPDSSTYNFPVLFSDHTDWQIIKETYGISKENYITKLLSHEYSVAMLGFLPGFLYFNGLPSELAVPRKKDPAKRIAAGSLAIGGEYLGFYSLPSPGGWQVIGQSPIKVLDATSLPPVALKPGDRIIMQTITPNTYKALVNNPLSLIEYNELL